MLTSQDPNPDQKRAFVLWRPFLAAWTWLVPPTQAHMDRQSRTARFTFLAIVSVLALSLMVLTLVKGREWHHDFKRWMSDRDAAEAVHYEKEMMDYLDADKREDAKDAGLKAQRAATKAYQGDSDNPAAIRVLARILTMGQRSEARFLWDKLAKMNEMTDDDFGWRVRALANIKEDKTASDQIEQLLKESTPTRKVVETADGVMQRLGRSRQLLVLLKKYVADKPDDFDTKLLLGMRQTQFGTDDDKTEGRKLLWELSTRDDDVGLHALEFLDRQKDLSVEEQKQLIDRLEHHPERKEIDHIAVLRRMAHLPGADKEDIMRKALAEHAHAKREDLVPLCRWLLDEGEFEMVENFLKDKEELLRDYTPLLDHYLTALTRLNDFDALQRMVEDPRVSLTTAQRAFHRVHLAYVLRKPEEQIDKLLVDAVTAAIHQNDIPMLLDLGRYAEQRQHYRTALEAYKAASVSPQTERLGYDGLLRVSYLMGNTKEFNETAQETCRRWPDNQYYLERSLYASLLAGIDMENAIARSEKLFDARPNDSQRKILMGLAHYRMADPQASRRVLEGINLEEISAGQRAVLCGLIHAAGLTRQAGELAQSIPDNTLMLPEESAFLRRAKASPDVATAPRP